VFSNPVKILSGLFLQMVELKRVLFPFYVVCTLIRCLLAEFPFHRMFSSSVSFVLCTYAPAQCPLGRALRILNDFIFSLLNSQQSSSNCTLCLCSMPTWQSLYRTPKRLYLQLCLLPHSLASKVFNNLEVFLLSC
jgi:hypothetical protein